MSIRSNLVRMMFELSVSSLNFLSVTERYVNIPCKVRFVYFAISKTFFSLYFELIKNF